METTTIIAPKNFGVVLSRLKNVRSEGRGFIADCPCPGHKTPAGHLSITDAGDRALVKCFNKHSYIEITQALGFNTLTYNEGNRHYKDQLIPKEIKSVYQYKKNGAVVFEIVRYEPKTFRARRPDGKGGYIWNLVDEEDRILYNLDELESCITSGETVYLPEGEKDADNLVNHGLVATTNPLGQGKEDKWLESYTESLRHAKVVILADDDDVGIKFAHYKARVLSGVAQSVKVIQFPDAHDVSDWFSLGHTAEELTQLAQNTPEWTPASEYADKLICLADVVPTEVSWFYKPYIARGKVNMLQGDPGNGKSTVAGALAAGGTRGASIGQTTLPVGNVLLMSAEDGLSDTLVPRFIKLGADRNKLYAPKELFTLDEPGLLLLDGLIQYTKPILVIIDPIVAYLDGKLDMHRANQVRQVMAQLAVLAEKYDAAILAIRHMAKTSISKAILGGIGSIDFTAAARSVIFAGYNEDTQERALIHVKCNLAPLGESIGYQLVDGSLLWTGKSELTYQDCCTESGSAVEDAKAWLEQTLFSGAKEADFVYAEADKRGISRATLRRAKKALNVVTSNRGEPGKKGAGKWYWSLKDEGEAG